MNEILLLAQVPKEKDPYLARSASNKNDNWPFWYVCGSTKLNILRFKNSLAIFTSRENAEIIADE